MKAQMGVEASPDRRPIDVEWPALNLDPGGLASVSRSPQWTKVVRVGRCVQELQCGAVHSGSSAAVSMWKKRHGNAMQVVGTWAMADIETVRSKLVRVFATRFSPDLDPETLSTYLKAKLDHEAICQKIVTDHSRFASFKVSVECNKVCEIYTPELWLEWAHVRRFCEQRRAGSVRTNGAGRMMTLTNHHKCLCKLSHTTVEACEQ